MYNFDSIKTFLLLHVYSIITINPNNSLTNQPSVLLPKETIVERGYMKKEVEKELFVNVYGYDSVKRELNLIKSWLTDPEIINNNKIMIPSGVLFYGVPGCGKTLIVREFAESFHAPIYVIEGKEDNICNEITTTFAKARQDKFAIVVIDEIDLLIGRSNQIERTMQQELDGLNTKGSILVLATTNNLHELPDPLLRPGRFDRTIKIDYPDKESRKKIFTKFLNELGLSIDKVDLDHVSKVCSRCNGAEIKAIVNDCFLRNKQDISTEEVEKSYERIVHDNYEEHSSDFKDMRVSIHECGHALMALHFRENWTFYKAKFNEVGGVTEVQEANEQVDTVEKRKQNIMIALSGYVAEEVVYGNHEVGSYKDYIAASSMVERLVQRVCMYGVKNLITPYEDNRDRYETPAKRRRLERIQYKLMKSLEKETRKVIEKNISNLQSLANQMYNQGTLSYSDVQLNIC